MGGKHLAAVGKQQGSSRWQQLGFEGCKRELETEC